MKVADWLILALAAGAVVLALRKMGGAAAVADYTVTDYGVQYMGLVPGGNGAAEMVWI